jgi:hypothetical protein
MEAGVGRSVKVKKKPWEELIRLFETVGVNPEKIMVCYKASSRAIW